MHILLAEDDQQTAQAIMDGLSPHGLTVTHAPDGGAALELAAGDRGDIWVIDRMMPRLNGLDLIDELRRRGDQRPVLMLSAMSEVEDRVLGLRAGADDYLVKPFALEELLARIEVLGRRAPQSDASATVLSCGDLELDLVARRAQRAGQIIDLVPREFSLLLFLMQHQGKTVTRDMLLEHVFQLQFDPQTNLVDVHISRLRAKLDHPFDRPMIRTIRGAGFMLEDPDAV